MIAAWMAYAIAVGLVITATAWVAERAVRMVGRPARFLWLAAIVASGIWPVIELSRARLRANETQAASVSTILMPAQVQQAIAALDADVSKTRAAAPIITTPPSTIARVAEVARGLDTSLLLLWIGASLLLLWQLGRSLRLVRRGPMEWRPRLVDGRPVLISRAFGPAVVGVRDLRVVVPEWVLELGEAERALVLDHEHEHRAARDPYLLITAALAAVLVPWNPAVWIQARRLRLAIELDCDARVLARRADIERYGSLLIAMVERRLDPLRAPESLGAATAVIVAALTETSSDLERRIIAMTASRPRNPKARASALVVAAAAVLTIAWRAPVPANATPHLAWQQSPAYPASQVDVRAALTARSGAPTYPRDLSRSDIQGRVAATFIVDTSGRIEQSTVKISEASHGLFAASVRTFLDTATYTPAIKGGRAVRQIVEMPIGFSLLNGAPQVAVAGSVTTGTGGRGGATGTGTGAARGRGSISGKVAGVTITAAGRPGDSSLVQIRGIAAPIRGRPLYVVDGVVMTDTTLTSASFNGLDISSVEVIRGAAASALYGSRADSGVIAITTKGAALARTVDSSSVQIRAISAPFKDGPPLYVVDGVIVTDPNVTSATFTGLDIASVEVIRGAAAQSLYGARAADGVISITTKGAAAARGRGGRGGGAAVRVDTLANRLDVEQRPVPNGTKVPMAITRLDAEQMPVPTLTNGVLGIRGKVAGVTITPMSGKPGDSTVVVSHAALSSYRSQGYLFVIDGVALLDTTNFNRTVDNLRLDSVEVIRGDAATKLYGDRATNGVVSLVTKKRH